MKTSPARRVHQILRRALDQPVPQPIPTLAMWARVFGVEFNGSLNHPPAEVEDAVLRLLADVRAEVAEVARGPYTDQVLPLIQPLVTAAWQFTATSQLHQDWAQGKANILRAEIMVGWWWAAEMLPAREDTVTEDALEQLRTHIADLEAAASSDEVPSDLQRFVKRQADTIRVAIRRYSVAGIAPLQNALSQSLGDALRDQHEVVESIKSAPDTSIGVMKKLHEVWKGAVQLAGDFDKIKKGFVALNDIYRKAVPLLENLKDSIDP